MLDNFEIYAELESKSENEDKYFNIGNLLRNRRLDMDISIDIMAKALKLSSKYIELMEEGNYDDVAQKIYYFGYIRNISRYLKLDEEIILRYLVEEIKSDKDVLNNAKNQVSDLNILTRSLVSAEKNNKNNKNYITYILILVLIGIGGFIIKQQSDIKNNSSALMLRHQNNKMQ